MTCFTLQRNDVGPGKKPSDEFITFALTPFLAH